MPGPTSTVPYLGCCGETGGPPGPNYKMILVNITLADEDWETRLQDANDEVDAFDFDLIDWRIQRTVDVDDVVSTRVVTDSILRPSLGTNPSIITRQVVTALPAYAGTLVQCSRIRFRVSDNMDTVCTRHTKNTSLGGFPTEVECFRSALPIDLKPPQSEIAVDGIKVVFYHHFTDPTKEHTCCPPPPP